MIRFKNKQFTITLDKNFNSPEELKLLIEAIIWYIAHIEHDHFFSDYNYYICELLRMMTPDELTFNNHEKTDNFIH